MIYKEMPITELNNLHNKVGYLVVKFPKSDKLFHYEGEHLFDTHGKITLFQIGNGHTVQTSAEALLVQMDYHTYELHKLVDESDYDLALSLFDLYFDSTETEIIAFVYLLGLTMQDYEAEHYPIPSTPVVDFIDCLLEERGLAWTDVRDYMDYGSTIDSSYIRVMFEQEKYGLDEVRQLSHFFRLPVQCFITGGYGE
jgi:antitoxin component HigA of HigAB toxin-antitoxin module